MSKLAALQHALGVDEFGRGRRYRRHFVAGPGHDDYATCEQLVVEGLMVRRPGSALTGGDDLFLVTLAGEQWMAANSPTVPKRTRSQERYARYVDSETSMSFREWLQADHLRTRLDRLGAVVSF